MYNDSPDFLSRAGLFRWAARLVLALAGLMPVLVGARALAGTAFTDTFSTTTISSNWASSGSGTTGGSTTFLRPGIKLSLPATKNAVRFIQSAATNNSNYSFINTTETFQATVSAVQTTTSTGAGFTLFLVGSGAQLTGTPTVTSPNVLGVVFVAAGGGKFNVEIEGKVNSAGATPIVFAALPSPVTLGSTPLNVGFTISNTGTANASALTFYCGSTAQTVSLPTQFNTPFAQTQKVYLLLMANNASNVANAVSFTQVTANGFTDLFGETSLAAPNWTGAGGGSSGSKTAVGNGALTLTTATGAGTTRWVEASAANYSFINNTESFEATVTSTHSDTYSGFVIYLVGSNASSSNLTNAAPWVAAPTVVGVYFCGYQGQFVPFVIGKTNGPGAQVNYLMYLTGASANLAMGDVTTFPYGQGTFGFNITNNGANNASTLTVYYEPTSTPGKPEEPVTESYQLPSSYNSAFAAGSSVHAFLMAVNGTAPTSANAVTFSQFTATAQPVITANVAVNASQVKQTIAALGGDYAKNSEYGGDNFVDDTTGIANLASLQPTYVRTAIPLEIWEPAQQTITPANINVGAGSYWAQQDTGNLHNSLQLLSQLQAGGVDSIIFSVWNLPPWMYSNTSTFQVADTPAGREAVLGGIATYLIYAHLHYGLDLSKIYLSFNESDWGTNVWLSPQEYADFISDANTYFARFTDANGNPYFPNPNIWVAGDTCVAAAVSGVASPHGPQVGTASATGFSGSFTDNIINDLVANNGGNGDMTGIAAIGFHSWDTFLDASVLNQIATMGAHYGLPVFSPEIGQVTNVWESSDATTIYEGWDWGRTLLTTYQRVLNYSGASIAMPWEYMNDFGLRDATANAYPFPSYYLVSQLVNTDFPAGSVILGTTVSGNVPGSPADLEAIAGEASSSTGYATTVQIIQNDSRGVGTFITGLKPNTTYTASEWNATNAAYSTKGKGAPTSLGTLTTDSTGAGILNIPPAPIEADAGKAATYVGSGSVVTLQVP